MVKVLLYVYVVLSLLIIAALSSQLYKANEYIKQTMFNSFVIPKDKWVCALEFVPDENPADRQCVAIMDRRLVK